MRKLASYQDSNAISLLNLHFQGLSCSCKSKPHHGFQVEVERMRSGAHDKLMNKLAAVRHKAEEKRAMAEAKRNCQAAKIEEQGEYIRRTGRVPSSYLSFSCCNWCS